MQKDAKPNWNNPAKEQLRAFETLKEKGTSPPVLALPRAGKTYMLDTDPSAYQLGCTLLQEEDDESWKPVDYWSYLLNSAERKYSAMERVV